LRVVSGDTGRQALARPGLQGIIACEHELEEALHLLVHALETRPRRGKKPVVVHGMRVATFLAGMGYPSDVVVAGALHDVLEKTALPASQITRRFGAAVTAMVLATTNDAKIDDPLSRYLDSVLRCAEVGKGALVVRAADLIDNCDRLLALGQHGRLERVAAKLRLLTEVAKSAKVDARILDELQRRYRKLGRKVGGLTVVARKASSTSKALLKRRGKKKKKKKKKKKSRR
jgi:(p)ppGpp synthase/HD superfamily hydrolase